MKTMFDSIPSIADRLSAFAATMAVGIVLLLSTSAIIYSKHRMDPAKRACGLIVCVWVAGCFMAGGTYGAFFGGDKRYLVTFGMYGLILGPILGNMHASFVDARFGLLSPSTDLEQNQRSSLGRPDSENP